MLQNNALYNRSQQQNQQYNNSRRSSSMGQGTRRFGQ